MKINCKTVKAGILVLMIWMLGMAVWPATGSRAQAEGTAGAYVVDDAGLLTDTEKETLQAQMQEISSQYDCEIAVVTVNSYDQSDITAFADDTSDQNDFGYGKGDGGILFAISMGDRKWAISTYGTAISTFTDAGQKYITDRVVSKLSDGDYNGAFTEFATLCGRFLKQDQEGEPYDIGNMLPEDITLTSVLICILIGFLTAAVPIWLMVSELKTVHFDDSAEGYENRDTVKMNVKEDRFIRHLVTRTPRPKDNGSSGGSSVHTSSSGSSHGGSSGSF